MSEESQIVLGRLKGRIESIISSYESAVFENRELKEKLAAANAKAKAGNMGFIFDPSPVQNELAACSAKIDEYNTNLKFGKLASMEEVDASLAAFSALFFFQYTIPFLLRQYIVITRIIRPICYHPYFSSIICRPS